MLLAPFSLEEVQQYMCVALDRHDITDQIAAAVHERTGGLPLYIEQVKHCLTCLHWPHEGPAAAACDEPAWIQGNIAFVVELIP